MVNAPDWLLKPVTDTKYLCGEGEEEVVVEEREREDAVMVVPVEVLSDHRHKYKCVAVVGTAVVW